MKYDELFVKNLVDKIIEKRCSRRAAARLLGVSRRTVARWVSRRLNCLPLRIKRAAKRVWNRTAEPVLKALHGALANGKSAVEAWLASGKAVCLRTVQRWKARWLQPAKEPKTCRRYERRKIGSLMHSDWGVKRIKNGVRCCFTFYEDDATRRLYACRAYSKASLENTLDALEAARQEEKFKAVLTDCGRVYTKKFGEACRDAGVKSIHTRPYNPKCNGKAEAVVKKIKRFFNRFEVKDLQHAQELLTQFQEEYNNTPHSSLKYQTPLNIYSAKQKAGAICAVM